VSHWRRFSRSGRQLRRQSAERVETAVRLGPIELPGPIVAASGTFGHGDEVARVTDAARLGAVTTKSLAPYAWPGNPPPRLYPTAAGMLNSVGLQGPGVEHWVEHELPGLRSRGARVIASVWGRTVDDYTVGTKMLEPARDDLVAVEVNISCPNLEDRARMFAQSAEATTAVVRTVVEHARGLPVLVKLSPNVTDIREIAGAAVDAGATGLTLVNTVLGLSIDAERRRPVLGAGGGGLCRGRQWSRSTPSTARTGGGRWPSCSTAGANSSSITSCSRRRTTRVARIAPSGRTASTRTSSTCRPAT